MRTLDFPILRQLLGAYVNRDFPEEYGTVEQAVKAWRAQSNLDRRQRVLSEIDKLLAAGVPDAELGEFIGKLGCAYALGDAPDAASAFLKSVREQLVG